MTHTDPLIAAIQQKIDENEKALKPLLEERRYLDSRMREAQARYATTPAVHLHVVNLLQKKTAPPPAPIVKKPTFTATPNGPQETLLRLVELNDGIKSDALYDLALAIVRGTAKNPRRSLAETLRQLIGRNRISRTKDGGLHKMP